MKKIKRTQDRSESPPARKTRAAGRMIPESQAESSRSLEVIGSPKVTNFDQLSSEEMKRICREKSRVKNRTLWLQVLTEIEQFKDRVALQINSINHRIPKLATVFLFDKRLIGEPELDRISLKKSQLKSAYDALAQASATIRKSELKESFVPLDKEWCPLAKSLIAAIYEDQRITQEIETHKEVEAIYKELTKDKVTTFKVNDPKMFNLAPLLQQKETSRLAVLELKRKIIPDY